MNNKFLCDIYSKIKSAKKEYIQTYIKPTKEEEYVLV